MESLSESGQISPKALNFSITDSVLVAYTDPSPSPSQKLFVIQLNTLFNLLQSPDLQKKLLSKILSLHEEKFLLLILGHQPTLNIIGFHNQLQSVKGDASLISQKTPTSETTNKSVTLSTPLDASNNQNDDSKSVLINQDATPVDPTTTLRSILQYISTLLPVPFHALISTQNNHYSPPSSKLFKYFLTHVSSSHTFDAKLSFLLGEPLPESEENSPLLSADHKFAVNCGLSFKSPAQFLSLIDFTRKSERERMLAGEAYTASDPELQDLSLRAKRIYFQYNSTAPEEKAKRTELLQELLGESGKGVYMEPPFRCDYGSNIYAGKNLYTNFDCVMLDVARIKIGDNCMMAPKVQLLTAYHSIKADERIEGNDFGAPIVIGDNVWLGGGVIINPGVSIGDNTTIGAGSVVTKNIPEKVVAVGNPCKVIKDIKDKASDAV